MHLQEVCKKRVVAEVGVCLSHQGAAVSREERGIFFVRFAVENFRADNEPFRFTLSAQLLLQGIVLLCN